MALELNQGYDGSNAEPKERSGRPGEVRYELASGNSYQAAFVQFGYLANRALARTCRSRA